MPHRHAPTGPGARHSRPFPSSRCPPGAPRGALFIDRQAGVIREICASSASPDAEALRRLRRALDQLRQVGARIGVASHNRADSWETFDVQEITAMNTRIEAALGPIDLWCVCLVDADGGCACAEPSAGVLATGARAVGIGPERCAVLGERGRMTAAAESVGAPTMAHPPTVGQALADAPSRLTEAVEHLCRVVDAYLTVHLLEGVDAEGGPGGPCFN